MCNLQAIFLLLVVFQVKHFMADYVFQNVYMLQKGRPGWDFIVPLSIHCGIHAIGTLLIVFWWGMFQLWWLAALDFVIHFIMDRIKAGPRYLGRFDSPQQKAFWVTFGFDQMVHHLTHLFICWILLQA